MLIYSVNLLIFLKKKYPLYLFCSLIFKKIPHIDIVYNGLRSLPLYPSILAVWWRWSRHKNITKRKKTTFKSRDNLWMEVRKLTAILFDSLVRLPSYAIMSDVSSSLWDHFKTKWRNFRSFSTPPSPYVMQSTAPLKYDYINKQSERPNHRFIYLITHY